MRSANRWLAIIWVAHVMCVKQDLRHSAKISGSIEISAHGSNTLVLTKPMNTSAGAALDDLSTSDKISKAIHITYTQWLEELEFQGDSVTKAFVKEIYEKSKNLLRGLLQAGKITREEATNKVGNLPFWSAVRAMRRYQYPLMREDEVQFEYPSTRWKDDHGATASDYYNAMLYLAGQLDEKNKNALEELWCDVSGVLDERIATFLKSNYLNNKEKTLDIASFAAKGVAAEMGLDRDGGDADTQKLQKFALEIAAEEKLDAEKTAGVVSMIADAHGHRVQTAAKVGSLVGTTVFTAAEATNHAAALATNATTTIDAMHSGAMVAATFAGATTATMGVSIDTGILQGGLAIMQIYEARNEKNPCYKKVKLGRAAALGTSVTAGLVGAALMPICPPAGVALLALKGVLTISVILTNDKLAKLAKGKVPITSAEESICGKIDDIDMKESEFGEFRAVP